MISILIPTYNYNAFPLVKEIHNQLTQSKIVFEIICLDDASDNDFNTLNETVNTLSFSSFILLNKNVGRSSIRNLLVSHANYDWLLFLDNDVFPVKTIFINNYLSYINKNPQVVCGGIEYQSAKPNREEILRWVYGKKREEISLSIRELNPYHNFLSANFLIHKSIFSFIKFNENLTGYGHEDTLFALDLKKNNVVLKHINNSVYHLGLETSIKYINKTEKAIENALYLYQKGQIHKTDIRLLNKFLQLKSYRITNLVATIFSLFKNAIIINLCSKKPSLFLFDMYKLGYLCIISKR